MSFLKPYFDPNTGISLGTALWVVGEVVDDTRQHKASILMNVYVGLTEYSAGRMPLTTGSALNYDVSGSGYLPIENLLRQRAQTYVVGLPEYSGATVVP